jgi:hypothetical protein
MYIIGLWSSFFYGRVDRLMFEQLRYEIVENLKSLDIAWLSLEFKKVLWTSTWYTHHHEEDEEMDKK